MFYYKGNPYVPFFGTTEKRFDMIDGNLTEASEAIITEYLCMENSLYRRIISVRGVPEEEMPSWLKNISMVSFEPKAQEVLRFDPESKTVTMIDPDMDISEIRYHHCDECVIFAMRCLFEQNKFLYEMLTNAKNAPNMGLIDTQSFVRGLLYLIMDTKKQTQMETLAKTVGVKFAISQISNNIDCVQGKKALVLKFDQLHRIKTMRLDDCVPTLQALVQNGAMSLEQVEKFIEGMRYLLKFKIDESSRLNTFFSRYSDAIIAKKINLEWLLATALKSAFTLDLFTNVRYFGGNRRSPIRISALMGHYMDAVSVLADGKYPTNNIEIFHVITTRNKQIFETLRPEEFSLAAEKLRKLIWDNGEYLFRPIQTEEELFYIGERYNNCLPVYRDKIIDEGAVVVAIYKKNNDGELEECPGVVFEVSPRLDIFQIKTYNDEDVTDPEMIALISEWKKAKSYLLTNGRLVYRDPEPEKAKLPKNDEEYEATAGEAAVVSVDEVDTNNCVDNDSQSGIGEVDNTEIGGATIVDEGLTNQGESSETDMVIRIPVRSIEKENGQFAIDIA